MDAETPSAAADDDDDRVDDDASGPDTPANGDEGTEEETGDRAAASEAAGDEEKDAEGGGAAAEGEEEESSSSDKEGASGEAGEEGEGGEGNAMDVEEGEDEEEEELPKPQEMSYSTRGRAADSGNDPLERLAREALGELTRDKPSSSSALRESFLSDSITEEERRTRTRYIPAVEGMHTLRKHEIKGDLSLARTNFSSAGVATTVAAAKAAKSSKRTNSMDMDGDDGAVSIDDDRASDILRVGTKTVEIGMNDLVIPSTAFIAPPTSEGTASSKSAPDEVEAITAFNPPRPPESVGPKKRHRMLRWERRPADIEVDLNNYRKTVHRTREELKNAEAELHRLETVDNHLRRHFLNHLQCLSDEWKVLSKELSAVQHVCVNSAELLTSRTRSRGAGKSNYAMRDVLTVLRTKGQEIEAKGLSLSNSVGPMPILSEKPPAGIGGVSPAAFEDWDRSTELKAAPAIASSWIVPGDSVRTPYGDGTVVAVYGKSKLDVNEEPHKDLQFGRPSREAPAATDHMDVEQEASPGKGDEAGKSSGTKGSDGKSNQKKGSKSKKKDGSVGVAVSNALGPSLAPRVAVRFSFGVGFFPLRAVESKEAPSTYSDARLAMRWKGLADTAVSVGGFLDIEGMANASNALPVGDAMDVADESGLSGEEVADEASPRILPFGAGMFPTGGGRGASLWKASYDELDKTINDSMFQSEGVLGRMDNPGMPSEVRNCEDDRQRALTLRGQVLQLRNELYRQRRVRMLNERTYASYQERAGRVEALVSEMRTDLKTLKRRLDEEVTELGISDEEAEKILTTFYDSFDHKDEGDPSLPKRARRLSRMEAEEDVVDDDDDEDEQETEQVESVEELIIEQQ